MIKQILKFVLALFNLSLVVSCYTAIYGFGVHLLVFIVGNIKLNFKDSLLCGFIILSSQTLIHLIKKGL